MFKLALNAGHGLNTHGKRCNKYLDPNETREWVLNSRICNKIQEKLNQYNNIEILRLDDTTGQKDVALKARTDTANNWNADLYLAIHHNAGINNGFGGGLETYIYTKASKTSKDWQNKLYDNLIKHTNLKGNRSDGTRQANLHEVRESNMPAVLIECGFMDSKTDVPVILQDSFAEEVANACVETIVEKIGLTKKAVLTATSPTTASPSKNSKILEWQKCAIADGYIFPKYGADGSWGNECKAVAKVAICKKRIKYININLTLFIQKYLGIKADGKFGNNTKNAVQNFQKKNGLKNDGVVGYDTWKKILNV